MTISRKPWERRLEDLAHLLNACTKTYFEPDLFRRNTNQFLQTARTITFIIQKNKEEIPNFDAWYNRNIIEQWKNDKTMKWAKDARNFIEKEGDLEVHSTLSISLIYSYLEEDDITIPCSRHELLEAGVKKLVRFSQKHLPTGIADAAGIKIERKWATTGLASLELTQALTYVYSRIYESCFSLARHLDKQIPTSIPEPSELSVKTEQAKHVELIKLSDMARYHLNVGTLHQTEAVGLPSHVKDKVDALRKKLKKPHDFSSAKEHYTEMAHTTFEQWESHIPILFLLNKDWATQYMATPFLTDQTDKYFFWRMIGETIKIQKPRSLVFTAEVWFRDLSRSYPSLAIRKLPIKGEHLQTTLIDSDGNASVTSWEIHRTEEKKPELGDPEEHYRSDETIFFLVPAMRAMGIEPSFFSRPQR